MPVCLNSEWSTNAYGDFLLSLLFPLVSLGVQYPNAKFSPGSDAPIHIP
jgi:hypothetical protein